MNTDNENEIILLKSNYLIPILNNITKRNSSYSRYKVNAHYLNCSCKEYRLNTKYYELRDLRRICKHIFFIITRDYRNSVDELTSLLLEHRFWDKIENVIELKVFKENIFVGFEKDLKFVRIYRKYINWKYYSYLIESKSWEHNLPPFKSSNKNEKLISFLLAEAKNNFNLTKSSRKNRLEMVSQAVVEGERVG